MENIHTRFERLGIGVPNILIPGEEIDLKKWAVVACDQYTSEPGYWKEVEEYVGDSPSTLKLIFPEVYLQREDKTRRIEEINERMRNYLDRNIFRQIDSSFIFLRRKFENGAMRKGLILALDLEKYSYEKGAKSLIRATEGTILDRLPPRIAIRRNAPLELPHIMVLIDDETDGLFSYLEEKSPSFEKLYDTPLMQHGGAVEGYRVGRTESLEKIASFFETLMDRGGKPGEAKQEDPFLFAMGDGNHSLATAKAIWEELKKSGADMNHPARWALVEIVNIYDSGLLFEPIHRLLSGMEFHDLEKAAARNPEIRLTRVDSFEEGMDILARSGEPKALAVSKETFAVLTFPSRDTLAVAALDSFLAETDEIGEKEIDYIHGARTARQLAREEKRTAFILPDFRKDQLFPTVMRDGALPRKTFSMGEAQEKRYYFEARRIQR